MKTTLFALLLLLALPALADSVKKLVIDKFDCRSGNAAMLNAGKMVGVTIQNSQMECPIITQTRSADVTINGIKYEWCGPTTKDGWTPCLRAAKKEKP